MALSYAAEGGDVEVVAKLVELGAEVDRADKVRIRIRSGLELGSGLALGG